MEVVFNYLMCLRGSESLVTMKLIILQGSEERKTDELQGMSLGLYDIPHYLQQC